MYMTRDLIDDHENNRYPADAERPRVKNLIGMVVAWKGAMPEIVSCGSPHYDNILCLNLVRKGPDHALHLTVISTVTLQQAQLRQLKAEGTITVKSWDEDMIITLLKDPHAQ